MKKAITNIETGITELVDMTAEEIADYNEYKSKTEKEIAEDLARRTANEAKRSAALAKLEALGLDEDDLKALGL